MIYADNAATTKISDRAFEQMLPFLREQYGNASSQYSHGVKAKRAIEQARSQVAEAIHAKSSEIFFTSGGSEANNWVLHGVLADFIGEPPHLITTSIEHHSILNASLHLKKLGVATSFLPVNGEGQISVHDLEAALRPNTKLVSVMFANNEIGTIQPIMEICQLLHSKGILFHTDAVQAVGHIPIDLRSMPLDFLTASAHKFNGAKGTGILYKRSGLEIPPLIRGGGQEHQLRAGTENVAGIVSAGYAIEESITEMSVMSEQLGRMVSATILGIVKKIPSVRVNGSLKSCLPGIVNLGFNGVAGESLMHLLDLKGICVSTSSACASGTTEPSHVLLALGLSEVDAKSAIRISYGRNNSMKDVETIVSAVCDAYTKIIGG